MNRCLDCGKEFDPKLPGASPLRGPICNKKYLESWKIPEEVSEVLNSLTKNQFPVYLVGGSVRDYLLGRKIKDYDLVTSAKTEELEKIFPNSLEVGKQFGVVKVPVEGDVIEIATFREDGTYSDGRRPDYIKEGTMESDVQRRDFTINGLLFDLNNKEVIDKVGGLEDLQKQQIRCIGNPTARFQEDYLRVLRTVRFATVLNFTVEEKTLDAAIKSAPELTKISKERIKTELDKTFNSEHLSKNVNLIEKLNLLPIIFPHLKPEASSEILSRMRAIKEPSSSLVYSWIFNKDVKLMNQYKLTNDEIKLVSELNNLQTQVRNFDSLSPGDQNQTILHPNFNEIKDFFSTYKPLSLKVQIREEELTKNPLDLTLLTSGKELLRYGFTPGKDMGELIKELNHKVYSRELNSPREKHQFILSKKK